MLARDYSVTFCQQQNRMKTKTREREVVNGFSPIPFAPRVSVGSTLVVFLLLEIHLPQLSVHENLVMTIDDADIGNQDIWIAWIIR